ncbi:TIGR04282 family arsenosugar biosynthesis glycosyltransferase [Pelovirga terrestris]|uniref:TIGR04282 family arsenosugar biosynthesis glycosyltransferase n=1 Tax=Pelovirga terrestris TaxID=2771352 RepID=A0A8J6QU48_9BACT|nr:TIGR04282 family arsenosugar biosynthesis glycosyltransferase [Pelovirga terrestris]
MEKSVEKVDKWCPGPTKNRILGIFAKQPVPGRVKTRLCPPLTPEQAADLYQVCLQETVTRMQSLVGCELAICYSGDKDWFAATFPGITLVPQRGSDLGARLAQCLSDWLTAGYGAAVLIGSDAPDLPLERIEQAFSALETADLVHGPALDGGYYLVGETTHHAQLFQNISWSTDEVLAQSLAKATQLGLRSVLLEPWDDLDDLPALLRLVTRTPHSSTAIHITRVLNHSPDTVIDSLT